jgi:ribosomal protein S18 acetylase RimI-like enzyme
VSSELVVEIRKAEVVDLDLLVPLFDAYRQFYRQRADPLTARGFLTARLEREESVVLLATSGALGRGFVQLYPSFCSVAARPIWILYDLFVDPSVRQQGVARRLMQAAAALASATGAQRLVLSTADDNHAAQALYESLGYRRDTVFRHYELNLEAS